MTRDTTATSRYGLWLLVSGPLIWSVHFLASYIAAALHCAKRPDVALADVRVLILVLTAAALAGIVWAGIVGLRYHLASPDGLPHDDDTPQDRRSFLGFATLLLAGLSAVAVAFVAMPILFFEVCR
ncbi:MAG: hypothetical protein JXB36_00545 [Gammaproteobacteria bacterium]|nr:hypothetical protein [Gammaproteobacteria bacterium]